MLPSSNNNNNNHLYTNPQLPSTSSSIPTGNNGMIPSFQTGSVDPQQQHQYSSLQPSFPNHPSMTPYHSIHPTSNGPGLPHHHGHHTTSLQPSIPIMNGNQKIPNTNNRFVFPNHPSMMMMNPSQNPYMPPHGMPSSSTGQLPQYSQEVVSNSRTIPPNVNNIPMNAPPVKYSNSTIMNNKYSTTISDNSTPVPTTQESYVSSTVPTTALPVWQNLVSEMVNPTSKKPKNELPLARIKKIMKSDEEVRTKTMISAEAPVLFAKACEMFIIELTLHAWVHTEESKRRTLQRNDIAAAIGKTDIFDFLIDIVPRENEKPATTTNTNNNQSSHASSSSAHKGAGSATTTSYHIPQPQQQQVMDAQQPNTVEEDMDDEDGFQIDDEDEAPSDDEEFEPQDNTPTKNEDVSKLLLPSLDPKSTENLKFTNFVPGVVGSSSQKLIERDTSAILEPPELASEPSQFLDDSQTFLLDNQ